MVAAHDLAIHMPLAAGQEDLGIHDLRGFTRSEPRRPSKSLAKRPEFGPALLFAQSSAMAGAVFVSRKLLSCPRSHGLKLSRLAEPKLWGTQHVEDDLTPGIEEEKERKVAAVQTFSLTLGHRISA